MTDSDGTKKGEDLLRKEASGLEVDDILALCYALQHIPERLRLYLDILRQRGGQRAQFACCLLCFDLARQGDPTSQREFALLADTVLQLARNEDLVRALLAADPYLTFIWDLCQAMLEETDHRFETEPVQPQVDTFATLDLLTDEDFENEDDFAIPIDDAFLRRQFDEAVEAFLGGRIGLPIYDPDAGFRMRNRHDVDRIERFLLSLESLRDHVQTARGFRSLTLLFYGTHMRSRSFFGTLNNRKQTLLQEGLRELIESGPQTWRVVGVMASVHAGSRVWQRISDVIIDYTRWAAEAPENVLLGPDGYDAVARLIKRDAERRGRTEP